jgi:hypothetical protein
MSPQVRYGDRNRLPRRPGMEFLWLLFPSRASVTVHVMGSEVVVVDAERLPGAIDEGEQNDGVPIDRAA